MQGNNRRLVEFEIRFECPGPKMKGKVERVCTPEDWDLTWFQFFAKYFKKFTLRSHHKIKSTLGKTFKPNDRVNEFIVSFKRDVKQCIVKIVSEKKPKGSGPAGSNAVSKMVKNLQLPPKKVQLQDRPQPTPAAVAASPPAKKKMPTAPPAPRISSGYTNANGVNIITNANRDKNTTNTAADRVSRDNTPRTSGYLGKNLFNPDLPVSAPGTGVNFRLNMGKYPEDDIRYPKAKGRANNVDDDDLDTASQLAQNGFFDDSSSVCSQDSQDDQTLPDIKTAFLKRFSLVSNTYFHYMLKEYTAFGNADQHEHKIKISWERRNQTTNSILADVCKGFTTPL